MLARTKLKSHANDFASLVSTGQFTENPATSLDEDAGVDRILAALKCVRDCVGMVYLVGNGGSAAVASHAATDFFNTGGLRAMTLHDPSTLTCFSNDYGYDQAFSMRLERLLDKSDLLIAISSSGQSQNILNAAECARDKGSSLLTLSGFSSDNPLRGMGDINYWIDSDHYGMVEIGHQFILHYVADLLAMEQQ